MHSKEKVMLIQEYLDCSDERRADLEKRYGRKQLRNFADTYMSEMYLKESAKKCPNCQTPIEKSEGCNKMTCYK